MSSIVFSNFYTIYDVLIDFPLFYAIVPIILVIIRYKLPYTSFHTYSTIRPPSISVRLLSSCTAPWWCGELLCISLFKIIFLQALNSCVGTYVGLNSIVLFIVHSWFEALLLSIAVRTIETLVVVYLPLQVGYTKLQVAIDKTTVLIITTTVLLRTSVYICTTIKAEVTMDYSPGYIIPDRDPMGPPRDRIAAVHRN